MGNECKIRDSQQYLVVLSRVQDMAIHTDTVVYYVYVIFIPDDLG